MSVLVAWRLGARRSTTTWRRWLAHAQVQPTDAPIFTPLGTFPFEGCRTVVIDDVRAGAIAPHSAKHSGHRGDRDPSPSPTARGRLTAAAAHVATRTHPADWSRAGRGERAQGPMRGGKALRESGPAPS